MTKYLIFFFILCLNTICYSQSLDTTQNSTDTVKPYVPALAGENKIAEPVRRVPESRIKEYQNDPDYAYANDPEYWKEDAPSKPSKPGPLYLLLSNKAFWWTYYTVMIILVLFGLYRLAVENNFSLFSGDRRIQKAGSQSSEEGSIDYNLMIEKYQSEGNYQLAIRYLYLRLLIAIIQNRNLRNSGSITNTSIAKAFSNQNNISDFKYLANAYEHIFYGGFMPDAGLYNNLKNKFDQFQKTMQV